ncbi:MAG: Eco57I restriction-modification methylase domain-containing protein [Bacilli bacterium]|nr:Eco57I restriction-modification methylase domain-containing protein [Bacilli bacterium]
MPNNNEALVAEEKYRTGVETADDYIENFDILETITNVGNDEVFTPRKTCDMILDSLPDEVWHNPNYKWLNPATKNGVFEREIAIRLDEGLKNIIKDTEKRRKHILQNMIFAIGQTKFTSNVARRTLYYCSQANRKCDGIKAEDGHYVNGYAIGNGSWFKDEEGNIKTPCTDHEISPKTKKCIYCNMSKDSKYMDANQLEKYAYEFIHINHLILNKHLQKRFFKGDKNMKFDVIIGNPPYQLSDGGAQSSARPIYHLFVNQAIALNPKYISMIIPSRWMIGGKGLDEFREFMINNKQFKLLHDFVNPKICFPNNDIKGGVCYFLWDRDYSGECDISLHTQSGIRKSRRYLKEKGMDIYVRDDVLIEIMKKVVARKEKTLDTIVSASKPYGFRAETMVSASKFGLPEFSENKIKNGYEIFGLGDKMKRTWKYLPKNYPLPKKSPCLNKYKVFIAEAYGCGAIGEVPSTPVLSTPVLSTPGQLCTETFLEIGPFEQPHEAENLIKYIKTKFFRALVGIQKQTQHTTQKVYRFVPILNFANNKDINWNNSISDINKQLYKKYNLTKKEIDYIEENIQEML